MGEIKESFVFNVFTFILGILRTNTYIIKMNSECLVIDPAAKKHKFLQTLENECSGLNVDIFLTHGHADHITGVKSVINKFQNAKIYLSSKDRYLYNSYNLANIIGMGKSLKEFEDRFEFIDSSSDIVFGDAVFKILHIPGHTPGSTALYNEKNSSIFVGDTLFRGSVGRTDLDGGNQTDLVKSIKDILFQLPPETVVYPGHGDNTTIGYEMKHNIFVMNNYQTKKQLREHLREI